MDDRRIEELQASIDRLRLEVEELSASRRRLVLAADADRRGIERELHDGPQQDLVGLAVNLQQARSLVDTDPAAAGSLVDELRGDVREALDRLRALAQRIHPPQLEAGGLLVALRSAAVSAGVPVRVEVEPGETLPLEIAAAVYFSFVEALERFSDGASAAIAVRNEDATVVFEIVESGSGLNDPADLASARDRVEALGGRLTISSEPGAGTRIAGSLPTRDDASRSRRGRGSPP